MMEQVKVEVSIPKIVDDFWKSIGYTQNDYQSCFLDVVRGQLDAVCAETPRAEQVIKILEEARKQKG